MPIARRPCFPIVTANQLQLLIDGDDCFARLWAALEQAQSSIWLETYMLEPDAVGLRTLGLLADAAQRGCEVILIYDHVGSSALWDSHLRPLRQAGGRVYAFNPVWPWRRHGPLLFRDHRKLLIVDRRQAFLGGRNISRRYAGAQWGEQPFRDLHAELRGPAVAQLCQVFNETLQEIGQYSARACASPRAAWLRIAGARTRVQVLPANARRGHRVLLERLRVVLARSRQYCELTTPYPVLSRRLLRLLVRQAQRGVVVRVLIPRRSDVRLVDWARSYTIRRLLHGGVHVYEYLAPLHAKSLVLDGRYSLIGSFNMDRYTGRHNLELGVLVFDKAIASELSQQFAQDLAWSEPLVHLPALPWYRRCVHWLAYQALLLSPGLPVRRMRAGNSPP